MSTVQQDSMVDTAGTALESHTPNTGAGWLKIFDTAQIAAGGSGLVVGTGGAKFAPYYTTVDSGGDDQRVTEGFTLPSGINVTGEVTLYAMLRCMTSDASRYEAHAFMSSAVDLQVKIKKTVAGVTTQLDSTSVVVSLPSSHTMEFSAVGTTLVLKIDGVTQLTVTDSAVSGSGNRRMGLRRDNQNAYAESSQMLLTSILCEDLAAGGSNPIPLINGGLINAGLIGPGLVSLRRR